MNTEEIKETEDRVITSFNNCWRAMAAQYQSCTDECVRQAMNLLAKIIGKVETELHERRKKQGGQITIDEWLQWLESEAVE